MSVAGSPPSILARQATTRIRAELTSFSAAGGGPHDTSTQHDISPRTVRLLIALHSPGAEAAGQVPHHRLVGGQYRGMGDHAADGAAVVAAADGPDADRRH